MLSEAVRTLENVELNSETEANWKTLGNIALRENNVEVAERCFAAVGDIAKVKYLKTVKKTGLQFKRETGKDSHQCPLVQAKLCMLNKKYTQAETILLNHNEVEAAMDMYKSLKKWDESIRIATKQNLPNLNDLKKKYMDWLKSTNQEDKAAEVLEKDGE